MSTAGTSRFGVVAVVGRPNVGKSTLVNRLLGARLCITASRPQTTRHRVQGVLTDGDLQVVLVDTPGLHGDARKQLNRALNRAAVAALTGVDLALFVVGAGRWEDDDALVRDRLAAAGVPVIGVVNQVDRVRDKKKLLPYLEAFAGRLPMAAVVPLSARTGDNLEALWGELRARIPAGEHAFPADELTDRSERFLAAELVREQLTRRLGEELPYALTVEVQRFEALDDGRSAVDAVIWVEREGQKAIVIGRGGAQLKAVGSAARLAMQRLFGIGIHLELWVKVRADWSDDVRALRQLGYEAE
ncbi:MAG: GTPase Era [Halofilum sp. (in: g-proteobacteria)]|nr:GTPase Era [Halofilum sp. (in: g-proteobacteria)]